MKTREQAKFLQQSLSGLYAFGGIFTAGRQTIWQLLERAAEALPLDRPDLVKNFCRHPQWRVRHSARKIPLSQNF